MKANARLTSEAMASMKLGGRNKTFRCDSAAELESARRNAYYVKAHCPRPDGAEYKIKTSLVAMTVTISLKKREETL